jgi:hypothetical protein
MNGKVYNGKKNADGPVCKGGGWPDNNLRGACGRWFMAVKSVEVRLGNLQPSPVKSSQVQQNIMIRPPKSAELG